MYLEVMKACLRAAEADAGPNGWGIAAPDGTPLAVARSLYGRTFCRRMAEIIQLLDGETGEGRYHTFNHSRWALSGGSSLVVHAPRSSV